MMKGDHGPTKLSHALTWGTIDNASYAPQVRACNYYLLGGNGYFKCRRTAFGIIAC